MYAGKICGKCKNGCNHDVKIKGLDSIYKVQNKRFGYICSNCITEIVGGEDKVVKMQQKEILKQMGL